MECLRSNPRLLSLISAYQERQRCLQRAGLPFLGKMSKTQKARWFLEARISLHWLHRCLNEWCRLGVTLCQWGQWRPESFMLPFVWNSLWNCANYSLLCAVWRGTLGFIRINVLCHCKCCWWWPSVLFRLLFFTFLWHSQSNSVHPMPGSATVLWWYLTLQM